MVIHHEGKWKGAVRVSHHQRNAGTGRSWGGEGGLGAPCLASPRSASACAQRSCPLPPPAISSNANRPRKFVFPSARQTLGINLWHRCVLLSGSACGAIWGWGCFLCKCHKVENHIVQNSTGSILLWISKLSFKSGWWSNYSLQLKCK